MKDLIKWYANIEVPQSDRHQNNLKIIWWLIFWSEKRKLRLGFGVHWDFSKQIPYNVPTSPTLSSCFRRIKNRGKKTKMSTWKPHPKLPEKINTSNSTFYSFLPDRTGVSSFPPNPCLAAYKYLTKEHRSHNCQFTKVESRQRGQCYYLDVVVGV
jgi:hypothetical protein